MGRTLKKHTSTTHHELLFFSGKNGQKMRHQMTIAVVGL